MSFTLYSVSGKDFIGRDEIVTELVKELSSKNKIGFSLSGIRRIGKTSILKEVKRRLEKKGIIVIYISAWRILPQTVDEFSKVLNRTTLESFESKLPKKFKFEHLLATGVKALASFLEGLKLSTSVSEDLQTSVSYVRKETKDVEEAITKTFLLIEHLSKMTKSQCVLIIDEFPSLGDLTYGAKNQKIGTGIVQLLRTLFEDFSSTKLVVSGSFRDTLDNLVAKSKAPFYKQLLLREIISFTQDEFHKFLKYYLPKVKFNKDIKDSLYDISGGIPFNLQIIGKEIQIQKITLLDKQKLEKIIKDVLKKEGEQLFKEFVDSISPSEIKVLKRLAISDTNLTPVDMAKQEFMDENTVNYSLNLLKKKGLVKKIERSTYKFTDSMFAQWLKQEK